jgi:peptidoglycan/LPS O-acetylase OafA/YrhL
MLGIISGCNIAHFHTPLNYKLSMPVIGLLCIPWIWHEMQHTRPPNWLVSAGQAGYSIYLMHQLGVHGVDCLDWPSIPGLRWLIGILAAALIICVFFFLVEKPSHRLAKRLGRTPNPHPAR